MAKKPGTNPGNEFVFFDVIYAAAHSAPTGACRPNCSLAWKKTTPRAGSSSGRIGRLPKNPDVRRCP